MQDPFLQASLVNGFFESALDTEKMTTVVDGALYREKVTTTA